MGRITSNIGLVTGVPITDTVDQLMQISARPKNLLEQRTQGLQDQQLAVNTLATRLLSLQFDVSKLDDPAPYAARTVRSQQEAIVSAGLTSGGKPSPGEYLIRPVQKASAQQFISQRYESLDDLPETGNFSFGRGGFVDEGVSLDLLNAGLGVARGQIRVTDLSGSSAVIDLTTAQTIDDVLDAINNNGAINVRAAAEGNRLVLSDPIGGNANLSVQEVANGTTASDLGLAGINTTATSVAGADVFALYEKFKLADLNDGNGVWFTDDVAEIDDLVVTLADGTTAGVDLSGTSTIGDVAALLNEDQDLVGKITAQIAADGERLEITDLTSGSSSFSIVNGALGSAADDLGLTEQAAGGVITGRRLVAGLQDTLLSSLHGGAGVEPLGDLLLTDRTGVQAAVHLSAAETLGDVIQAINDQITNIEATFNKSRNGVVLTDQTGASASNLIVQSGGGSQTAETLKLAVDDAVDSVNSGQLNRQTISAATLLSALPGGGVAASDISITDSSGATTAIDLNASGAEAKTVGDVIDAINGANVGVEASINATGDGILLVDTALGDGTLGVKDVNGTLAAALYLTRASKTIDIDGQETQVIDGATTHTIDLAALEITENSISLASLNDGAGIQYSDIRITDTLGNVLSFDLNGVHSGVTTVGQLIDALNADAAAQGVAVTVGLNNAGTGILITDTGDGSGRLKVEDVNGTAAASLKILSTETTTTTVSGNGLFAQQNASQGALNAVANAVNALDAGVSASTFFDGKGYRLSISVDQSGRANEILLDPQQSGLRFEEVAEARDALVVRGAEVSPGAGILISSPTNGFDDLIDGVSISIAEVSDTPAVVEVATSDEALIDAVQDFVDAYNAIRDDLDELTVFDEETLSTGLLFGTNEALRVDSDLSRVVTDRYRGLGNYASLEQIGLSVDDQGQLGFDRTALRAAFEKDPTSLRNLLSDPNQGVAAKFNRVIDRLAGEENGLLTNRTDSLEASIESNQARILRWDESLDRERERLLLQFFQLEQVVAQLQTSQQALSNLQPIPPLTSTRSST